MERYIIGICVAFVVLAAIVVSATQASAASFDDYFDKCLAKPAYQNALNTHGWDSPQELDAWYACWDEADAAYYGPDLPAVGTTLTSSGSTDNPSSSITLTDMDLVQMQCNINPTYTPPGHDDCDAYFEALYAGIWPYED